MPKRLLIAGHGFLGAAVEPAFVAAGWRVDCVNRSGRGGAKACDLSSTASVAALLGDYDLVIHCASSGGGGIDRYRSVYLDGCQNLLARFPQTPLIFTSSTSVYPQADHGVVTEHSPAVASTPRARILREAEELVLSAGGMVARLTGLYGPGRCHVLKNFLAGKATLDGDGERIMNFVHREDAAKALVMIAAKGIHEEIYNVNGGYAAQREIYQGLADYYCLPRPLAADAASPRKRGNTSKKVSSRRLRTMGWLPEFTDFLSLAHACEIR